MIEKIFIKGKVRARYIGKSAGTNVELMRTYKDIEFNEIWLEEAEQIDGYNQKVLTKEPYFTLPELKNVFISFKNEKNNLFFQEDFTEVVINEIEIVHPESNKTKGELNGLFFGTYTIYKPDPKPIIEVDKDVNKAPVKIHTNTIIEKPKEEPKLVVEPEQENNAFNQPWQPDEFLNNFNVKRSTWDGWRERWSNNSLPLFFLLFAAFLFVGLGWLHYPILWIPFIIILKTVGDILIRIFSPNFTQTQINSTKSTSKVRYALRMFYTFALIVLAIFFLYKKLYLFAILAGLLLIFHGLTYYSPLLYFLRRIFQGLAILLLLFFVLRFFNFHNNDNPLPVVTEDDDTELIPDKQDTSKKGNKYTMTWFDYQNEKYTGTFDIKANNYSI